MEVRGARGKENIKSHSSGRTHSLLATPSPKPRTCAADTSRSTRSVELTDEAIAKYYKVPLEGGGIDGVRGGIDRLRGGTDGLRGGIDGLRHRERARKTGKSHLPSTSHTKPRTHPNSQTNANTTCVQHTCNHT